MASIPPSAAPSAVPRVADKEARLKKDKRRRWIIAGLALLIMFSGVGLIAGTYFYDQVITPDQLTLENSTEVFGSDGKTQIAKLGSKNRSEVAVDKLPEQVRNALIAGEDKNFYKHHGIDLWGIGRAAWNNLTGGATQGASTITQQYARIAANDLEVSYGRKLREAVMARKLEDQYQKIDIMGFYLNTVYFGRGAYGIGAAAEVYFGIPPDKIETLKVEQAAVLGAVLRQPEPDGSAKGYDPQNDPQAATDRWNYVLNNMVEMKWLSTSERSALQYPKVLTFEGATNTGAWGYTDRGTGYVIRYVEEELTKRGVVKYLNENKLGNWKNAGLRITTTIDQRVQNAMEAQLNRELPKSALSTQAPNIIGAGVALEPGTGRVLAYYGGTNSGTNTDWAGKQAPHPPASSFKIYTLAAGVNEKISVKSLWDSRKLEKSKGDIVDLDNANREGSPTCVASCTLEQMTIDSFNVPFFELTQKIGPQKVMQMAANAGVRTAWTTDSPEQAIDLTKGAPAGRKPFDYYAGIGQYPITVLDHATGTATIANHGIYNEPHFVLKVERKNRANGKWEHLEIGDEKLAPKQTIPRPVADEVTGVLKQIPKGDSVAGSGRESAGKTGTWENGLKKADGVTPVYDGTNAHAWFTGFTTQVVATFWIGSNDYNKTPIKTPGGANIGSSYPRGLWKKFMDQVHKELNLPATKLPSITGMGLTDGGTGESPSPSPVPQPEPTQSPKPSDSPKPTKQPTTPPPPTVLPTLPTRKPG
ncbi:penicillin-binding protein [Rhizocola hellebori]|uniref:Penicillin-binding protein n=1 Tax=Rhizocola hellebori TaxID=1392758 RepID=A0A8J3QDU6_9ACTN|nr:penicillin-binding protein [Rhizocola hellebori]